MNSTDWTPWVIKKQTHGVGRQSWAGGGAEGGVEVSEIRLHCTRECNSQRLATNIMLKLKINVDGKL